MKLKLNISLIVGMIIISTSLQAQHDKDKTKVLAVSPLSILKTPTDTLKPASFTTGTPVLYKFIGGGYSFGVNSLGDRAVAQIYKVNTSYIVNGIALWVGAKQQVGSSDTLNVIIYKLDGPGTDTSGIINTAPDTMDRTLRLAVNNIDTTGLTFLSFPSQYIAYVDYAAGINFSSIVDDTIGLISPTDGDASTANLSWNQWADGTWHSVYDSLNWNMNLDLGIFMIVDESSANVNDNYFVDGIKLSQNQPNPASGSTLVQYEIESSGNVVLEIFDMNGKKIKTISAGKQASGKHSLTVPIENMSSGNYYYSLKADQHRLTKKMTIVQ